MDDYNPDFLKRALAKAKESVSAGGFPAGAVVVKDGKIIGEGISIGHQLLDPTAHGEMMAIRDACKVIGNSDLSGAVLYSSMQPCLMCFGAAMWGAVSKIFYACSQGAVSQEYYGGHYNVADINAQLLRAITLCHKSEYEAETLAVVKEWERFQASNPPLLSP